MKIFKKAIKRLNDSLTVIIVLGIIVMVNVISHQFSFRADLTDNKDYSISKATKRTVASLDDVVNIKTYFSRNLPPKYLNLQQEVMDMLDEYANASNGHIRVEAVDPAKMDNASEELGKKGIPTLQFNVLRDDSLEVVKGYLGLSIEYGGKSEVVPVIDSTQTLEYELTLGIKKLASEQRPVLGLVSSHGAVNSQAMNQAYSRLSQLYSMKTVDLKAEDRVPEDVSALLLVGLNQAIDDAELKKIDAFVISGKPAFFLIDGVNVNPQTGALKNQISLEKILNAYGADIKHDLIADVSSGRASFSSPGGAYYLTYQINYPLWPKILAENFNKDNSIVAGLSSVILPWASSVEVLPGDGRQAEVLIKTTDKAIAQSDAYNLEPQDSLRSGSDTKQYDMAVLLRGKMVSPFGQGETDQGRVVVVGDSDFVKDSFSGPVSDNLLFFQNLVDGLALDGDMIDIRSKGVVERPIKPVSSATKETMRYLNIFSVSILMLIFGFVRYFLRRRGRKQSAAGGSAPSLWGKAISFVRLSLRSCVRAASWATARAKKILPAKKVPESKASVPAAEEKSEEAYKDIKN